jgi:cobalt-zinc-cadmium resistance protein CzcA
VVIGGLMIATLLTLFVLPILYIIFEKSGKSKQSKIPVALFIIFACSGISKVNAQEQISLQSAIDTALKNNLLVKNEKLKAEYQQKLIRSSANLPQANLSTEFGQLNSIYNDTRFGLSQSFSFPTVYSNQKKVLNEEWKASVLSISLKKAEIRKRVSQIYYEIIILKEKERLLLQADSIYSEFVVKANLRFKTGETNILEKATAQSQRGGIFLQLKSLQEEIQLAKLQLALVLNSSNLFEPISNSLRMDLPVMVSLQALELHPLLKISDQQKITTAAYTRLERSKMLPDISLGYFNASIQGTGADNLLYSESRRFNSGHIGIGIPIFSGSQKARINASRVKELIADNEYQNELKTIGIDYESARLQYEQYLEAANYFEINSLPEAKTISQTADKQFINGDINYLDWVILNNQAIVIRSNYLDILKALNESIINLNYLSSKQ